MRDSIIGSSIHLGRLDRFEARRQDFHRSDKSFQLAQENGDRSWRSRVQRSKGASFAGNDKFPNPLTAEPAYGER